MTTLKRKEIFKISKEVAENLSVEALVENILNNPYIYIGENIVNMKKEKKYNLEILLIFIALFIILCVFSSSISILNYIYSTFVFLFISFFIILLRIKKVKVPLKKIRNGLIILLLIVSFLCINNYINIWNRTKIDIVKYVNSSTLVTKKGAVNVYTLQFNIDKTVTMSYGSRVSSYGDSFVVEGEYIQDGDKIIVFSENGSKYVFDVFPLYLEFNADESCIFSPDFAINEASYFYEDILSKLKHKIYNVNILE